MTKTTKLKLTTISTNGGTESHGIIDLERVADHGPDTKVENNPKVQGEEQVTTRPAATVSKNASDGRFLGTESPKSRQKVSQAISPQVEQKLAQMPSAYRKTYRKAMTGKSLRAAVNAFCSECVCWQREEVKNCTSHTCPLYQYRPYSGKVASPRVQI